MARKHGAKIKNMKRTDPNRPIACRMYQLTLFFIVWRRPKSLPMWLKTIISRLFNYLTWLSQIIYSVICFLKKIYYYLLKNCVHCENFGTSSFCLNSGWTCIHMYIHPLRIISLVRSATQLTTSLRLQAANSSSIPVQVQSWAES